MRNLILDTLACVLASIVATASFAAGVVLALAIRNVLAGH